MHEFSICSGIAQITERLAEGRRVERVRVDVGHLRQVVPDTLVHSWEMLVFATQLEGATLEVRYIPAVIECRSCGHRTELSQLVVRCEACSSTDTSVVAGHELEVTSIDVARAG